MITMLKHWEGRVEVNDKQYDNINDATIENKRLNGEVHIKLYPLNARAEKKQTVAEVEKSGEVKILVKPYMTKKATPQFDFMVKWNNDNPMPLRIMQGEKIKETPGMVYMKLHAKAEETITCLRCGKTLTNPTSRKYGIGPECITKIPMLIDFDIEDVDDIKEKLVDVEWEGWIIKSAILSEEEV